jgi:hypothetical protein
MSRRNLQSTTIGGVAGVILLAVATSPFWTVLVVKRHAEQIINDSLHGLTSSSLAGVNITDGFVEFSMALATTEPAVRDENIRQIAEASRRTDRQLQAYEATIKEPQQQSYYRELVESRKTYRQTRARVIELLQHGRNAEALQLHQGKGLGEFVAYKTAVDRLVQQAATEAGRRGHDILRLCNYVLALQGVLLVFFFVYAFFIPLVTFYERIVTRGDPVADF